jgi:hypothetical protein
MLGHCARAGLSTLWAAPTRRDTNDVRAPEILTRGRRDELAASGLADPLVIAWAQALLSHDPGARWSNLSTQAFRGPALGRNPRHRRPYRRDASVAVWGAVTLRRLGLSLALLLSPQRHWVGVLARLSCARACVPDRRGSCCGRGVTCKIFCRWSSL